jgi:CRP-like cAMP-binding protein
MATERFLAYLDPGEETALIGAAPVTSFDRGAVVLDQNVSHRALYVIDTGSVRVERLNGPQAVPLAILSSGEFFGEMSFVDGAPTSARIVAREFTQVRVIDASMVDNMEQVDQTFSSRFYRSIAAILVNRLRTTSMDLYV